MERLARTVMRHRLVVSLVWLTLFVSGAVAAGQLGDRLTFDFSLPGQPGDTAETQLVETYGITTFDTFVAVVTVPEGEAVPGSKDAVAGVLDVAVKAAPGCRSPTMRARVTRGSSATTSAPPSP